MTVRIKTRKRMREPHDALTALAPMLRVRPELQDFCRFGGSWRSAHAPEEKGWAAFHIVIKGACWVERPGQKPVRLEVGDVLLLPHGDAHVVYGGGDRHEFHDVTVTYRDYIRVKQTDTASIDTELVCGRLYLEVVNENILLRTLPYLILLRSDRAHQYSDLVATIREELQAGRAGAAAIARDLASALFVMLLREHLEASPPADGLVGLLGARETAKAVVALLDEPAKEWSLDELASIASVSRATLVRAFQRISGMPPQAFLTEVRLGIARNRIAQTSDSLAQIAADTGYQSEAALSRALHRRFSIRPGAMRRLAQEAAEATNPA
jgi:AraC family transcriptional activator of mtrCDE